MPSPIDLTIENRLIGSAEGDLLLNKYESLQTKLMEVAFGQKRDFQMSKFSSARYNIKDFSSTLNGGSGGISWIVGKRGSGKSEAIGYLFRQQIKASRGAKIPTLPIYISVSERQSSEATVLDMDFINRQAIMAIRDALKFLRDLEGHEGYYEELRKLLRRTDIISHDFETGQVSQTGPNGEWMPPRNFTISEFLRELLPTITGRRNPLRLTLYVDDADKITNTDLELFLSSFQTTLQSLTAGKGIRLVFSVKRSFMNSTLGAGTSDALSFVGLYKPKPGGYDTNTVLYLPELDELQSEDIHNLIKERLSYLQFNEEEGKWVCDFMESPHKSVEDVLGHPDWPSYSITNMRRNGAILTLSAWLAYREQTHIRAVLKYLESILNQCDKKPGSQLMSKDVENNARRSDAVEIDKLEKEFRNRISEIDSTKILKDVSFLNEERWQRALEVCQQAITYGRSYKNFSKHVKSLGLNIKSSEDQTSVFMIFLRLIIDLHESDDLLPEVYARTPDDIFSLFDHFRMEHFLTNVSEQQQKRELTEQFRTTALDIRGYDSSSGILGEAYKKTENLQLPNMDAAEMKHLTRELTVNIVSGLAKDSKDPDINKLAKGSKLQKIEESDNTAFKTFLLQYLAVRATPNYPPHEDFLEKLYETLNKNPLALSAELARWDEVIQEISKAKPENGSVVRCGMDQLIDSLNDNLSDMAISSSPFAKISVDLKKFNPTNAKLSDKNMTKRLKFEEEIRFSISPIHYGENELEELLKIQDPDYPRDIHGYESKALAYLGQYWREVISICSSLAHDLRYYTWIPGKGQPLLSQTARGNALKLAEGTVTFSMVIDFGEKLIENAEKVEKNIDKDDFAEDIDLFILENLHWGADPIHWWDRELSSGPYTEQTIVKMKDKVALKSDAKFSLSGGIYHGCPGLANITIKRKNNATSVISPLLDSLEVQKAIEHYAENLIALSHMPPEEE